MRGAMFPDPHGNNFILYPNIDKKHSDKNMPNNLAIIPMSIMLKLYTKTYLYKRLVNTKLF